jgi:hypothetical protein
VISYFQCTYNINELAGLPDNWINAGKSCKLFRTLKAINVAENLYYNFFLNILTIRFLWRNIEGWLQQLRQR